MIDDIFIRENSRLRQRQAPLLYERELFLSHLFEQGYGPGQLRNIGNYLLHVIQLMNLRTMRDIHPEDIAIASERWAMDEILHVTRKAGVGSARMFGTIAAKWFRFHNVLVLPPPKKKPYEEILNQFLLAMRDIRGMANTSLYAYRLMISRFLQWCGDRGISLSLVSLNDVDQFLEEKRVMGWCPRTLITHCNTFRVFFRYAENNEWCRHGIAQGILTPRASRLNDLPRGPSWKDVRRLLNSNFSDRPSALRTQAILYLCAIYALRSREIANLRLDDFDWFNEIVTIRRAKRGRIQQFPIQYEVGEAILRYLKQGRPPCNCRNVFLSVVPPYRPMLPGNVGTLIARRMNELQIAASRPGSHSLRHACATELLRKGSSLERIADFLGHKNIETVSVYARHDTRMIRKISAFSLVGLK